MHDASTAKFNIKTFNEQKYCIIFNLFFQTIFWECILHFNSAFMPTTMVRKDKREQPEFRYSYFNKIHIFIELLILTWALPIANILYSRYIVHYITSIKLTFPN